MASRVELEGGRYHVMSRVGARRPAFLDDRIAVAFSIEIPRRYGWTRAAVTLAARDLDAEAKEIRRLARELAALARALEEATQQ